MSQEIKKQLDLAKQELLVRNYSPKTIEAYLSALEKYFAFKKTKLEISNLANIKKFLLKLQQKGLAPQSRNTYLSAIKFYYHQVVEAPHKIKLKIAKKQSKLPIVLSREEIQKILQHISNQKHKLMVALSYGSGLRVSEIVSLKVEDLDLSQNTIHLKNAKGGKDRLTIFPKKLTSDLQQRTAGKKGSELVFPSQRGGKLTTRTPQQVFKKALRQAKIKKPATFHSLRHSFATHLLENGTDVRYVQELLGHKNIRTTQRYTRVTNPKLKNIKSPL